MQRLELGAHLHPTATALDDAHDVARALQPQRHEFDQGDFAGFTSQESSNLVWGGIKYLESGEIGLVYKLCQSRNRLIETYPS